MKKSFFIIYIFISNILLSTENDTIFFNTEWKQTFVRDSAKYYRLKPAIAYQEFTDYYIDGQIQSITTFSNVDSEINHGYSKYFYQNGKLESEGLYENGKKENLWKTYDTAGILYATIEYKNGKQYGEFIRYYSDGKIKRKDFYSNNEFQKGECWDENGKAIDFYPYETMSEFPNGEEGLMQYLQKNIKYPKSARKNNISGIVMINFVIDEKGKTMNAKVTKSISEELDREALRVINNMPKWKPGTRDGKPVRVFFDIPINFQLE